jgi:hypothetical protein
VDLLSREKPGVEHDVARAAWVFMAKAVITIALGGGLGACGDEGAGSPSEQCQDFVAAYCSKMTECALPSDRSRASQDCDFDFKVNLDCGEVRAVAGSMQACIGSIMSIDCASVSPRGSFPQVPGTCKILVR